MKANRNKYPAEKRKQWEDEVEENLCWYDYIIFPIALVVVIVTTPFYWIYEKIVNKQK